MQHVVAALLSGLACWMGSLAIFNLVHRVNQAQACIPQGSAGSWERAVGAPPRCAATRAPGVTRPFRFSNRSVSDPETYFTLFTLQICYSRARGARVCQSRNHAVGSGRAPPARPTRLYIKRSTKDQQPPGGRAAAAQGRRHNSRRGRRRQDGGRGGQCVRGPAEDGELHHQRACH